MLQPAQRLSGLTESVIRDMTRQAIKHNSLNLSQGFPDFFSPQEVLAAAVEAIQQGHNQYAITWGIPQLREQIAKKYMRLYGMSVDPDSEITITCGVSEAIMASLLGIINPGDKVIILDPSHENYLPGVSFAGGEPLWVSLSAPRFDVDEAELRAAFAWQPRAIIFNTPHNPTGKVLDRATLQLIADLCCHYNVIAITDEIYEHILYDGREHIPIASLPGMAERTITLSGITKTYAVTGWRIGWAIAPAPLSQGVRTVHDFLTLCAPTPLQHAAAVALTLPQSYYDELTRAYHIRRDKMMGILEEAGFQPLLPEGAYYMMADFSAIRSDMDDFEFTQWLTETKKVTVVPGSSFYRGNPALGKKMVRFAFPKQLDTLEEARKRLVQS